MKKDKNFETRLMPMPDEEEEVYYEAGLPIPDHPPPLINFELNLEATVATWATRGHHVFSTGIDTFVCVLLRNSENNEVQARLFLLYNADGLNFSLIPWNSIGNHSLFLGANQAFASVSGPGHIPNSAYVVDDDGLFHAPQIVNIDFSNGQQTILPYPVDIAQQPNAYMPGSWLAPFANCPAPMALQ